MAEKAATTVWDPGLYLRYNEQRRRAAQDLLARVAIKAPKRVIDLGCGPGNSAAVLRSRWPEASIIGLDQSAEMIEQARAEWPAGDWVLGDIAAWAAGEPYDLAFSNAALQWVHGHGRLIPHLLRQVAPGGALAFQMPTHVESPLHLRMKEIALRDRWRQRMGRAMNAQTAERPGFYYDLLAPLCREIDLWETEYLHVLESPASVIEFIRSTGLRPYLEALDTEDERREFSELLANAVTHDYPRRPDGRVLFPRRRLFVIAYR